MKTYFTQRDEDLVKCCRTLVEQDINCEIRTLNQLVARLVAMPAPSYYLRPASAWRALSNSHQSGRWPSNPHVTNRLREISRKADMLVSRFPKMGRLNAIAEVVMYQPASSFFLDDATLLRMLRDINRRHRRAHNSDIVRRHDNQRFFRTKPVTAKQS